MMTKQKYAIADDDGNDGCVYNWCEKECQHDEFNYKYKSELTDWVSEWEFFGCLVKLESPFKIEHYVS